MKQNMAYAMRGRAGIARPARYNRYNTDVALAVQLDCLPANLLEAIPRETRRDMCKRDLSRVISVEGDVLETVEQLKELARTRRLQRIVAALLRANRLYERMLASVAGGRRVLRENSERVLSLVRRVQPVAGLRRACSWISISRGTFHSWASEVVCESSVIGRCRKRHPLQITVQEERVIRDYATRPEYSALSGSSLYWRIIRNEAAAFSISTFRKYLRILGIARMRFRKPRYPEGIRASRPFEILHMDSTIFHLAEGQKVFINFIVDNFSRAILGWRVMRTNRSLEVAENLRDVQARFSLKLTGAKLITDDGSENCGAVLDFLEQPDISMEKVVAQVDISQSNSMVEAVNKVIKNEYLYALTNRLVSMAGVRRALERVVPAYNTAPKAALHGLWPDEVLDGEIPRANRFQSLIKEARAARIEANRWNLCGVC